MVSLYALVRVPLVDTLDKRGGTVGHDDPLLVLGAGLEAPRALPLALIGPEKRAT